MMTYEDLEKERIASCPICGSPDATTIAHVDRYGIHAQFEICSLCSLIFLNPRLTAAATETFYSDMYRGLVKRYRGETELRSNQLAYGVHLTQFLSTRIKGISSILDIGGSTGIVGSIVAKEFGCEFTVVDPNGAELFNASKLGAHTILGTLDDLPATQRYDLVLLCRCIDHFNAPRDALRKARTLLTDQGWLYWDYCDWLLVARSEGFTNSLHVDHPTNLTAQSAAHMMLAVGLDSFGSYVPPRSSCIGHLCRPGTFKFSTPALLNEVRSLQACERREAMLCPASAS